MGRRMGYLINKKYIDGEARDIETVVRLRPWIEDEWRNAHGQFKKTKLVTDYDAHRNIFKFKIIFSI
jgi:hypothetical protein